MLVDSIYIQHVEKLNFKKKKKKMERRKLGKRTPEFHSFSKYTWKIIYYVTPSTFTERKRESIFFLFNKMRFVIALVSLFIVAIYADDTDDELESRLDVLTKELEGMHDDDRRGNLKGMQLGKKGAASYDVCSVFFFFLM